MGKAKKIIYWIVTVWFSLGMLSSGIVQLLQIDEVVESMHHLGYPTYILTILGVWKILGVIVILLPKLPLIKEWAYAGFFFVASGAFISHIIMKDPFDEIFPAILLTVLLITSWYLRPEKRRLK